MKLNKTINLIIVFFLTGCNWDPFLPYRFKCIKSFSENVRLSTGCCLRSYGINNSLEYRDRNHPDKITDFYIGYNFFAPQDEVISIQKARCLIISIIEGFCKTINADEKIRSELIIYPFPPERMEMNIYFQDFEQVPLANHGVASVSCCEGNIIYERAEISYYNHETNTTTQDIHSDQDLLRKRFFPIFEETYEEAFARSPHRIPIVAEKPKEDIRLLEKKHENF